MQSSRMIFSQIGLRDLKHFMVSLPPSLPPNLPTSLPPSLSPSLPPSYLQKRDLMEDAKSVRVFRDEIETLKVQVHI